MAGAQNDEPARGSDREDGGEEEWAEVDRELRAQANEEHARFATLEEMVGYASLTFRLFKSPIEAPVREFDLAVLAQVHLDERWSGLSPKRRVMARRLGVDESKLGHAIARLHDRGLIRILVDDGDRRRQRRVPTNAGRDLLDVLVRQGAPILDALRDSEGRDA